MLKNLERGRNGETYVAFRTIKSDVQSKTIFFCIALLLSVISPSTNKMSAHRQICDQCRVSNDSLDVCGAQFFSISSKVYFVPLFFVCLFYEVNHETISRIRVL